MGDLEDALESRSSDLAALITGFGDSRLLEDLEIGGLFEDWRRATGERIDRLIASGVEARLRSLEEGCDWTAALALAESYLRRDPLDERVAASAIRANIGLGAAGAAKRIYQALQTALANELGVEPGNAAREALAFKAPAAPEAAPQPLPSSAPQSLGRAQLSLPDKPSIAVLPFRNLSGDPDQEYLTDAITEDIVAALSRWRWFFVIAHNSSQTYKGSNIPVDRFGRELGVRYVLSGSVRTSGNRIRVTTQLVDADDPTQFRAEKFDRNLTDILDLQDEITETVVAAIEPAMLNIEGTRLAAKGAHDYSAVDCYYRGMWHFHQVSRRPDTRRPAPCSARPSPGTRPCRWATSACPASSGAGRSSAGQTTPCVTSPSRRRRRGRPSPSAPTTPWPSSPPPARRSIWAITARR